MNVPSSPSDSPFSLKMGTDQIKKSKIGHLSVHNYQFICIDQNVFNFNGDNSSITLIFTMFKLYNITINQKLREYMKKF